MLAKIRQSIATNKQQTNKQTTIFSAKNKKKYFWAQFYKIWREDPFWTIFLKMMQQKVLSLQQIGQKR